MDKEILMSIKTNDVAYFDSNVTQVILVNIVFFYLYGVNFKL